MNCILYTVYCFPKKIIEIWIALIDSPMRTCMVLLSATEKKKNIQETRLDLIDSPFSITKH